jgi:hypothetical protein
MTDDSFTPERCTLHVDWYDEADAPCNFLLSEVAAVEQLALERNLAPRSFTSDCTNLVEVLECLAPFASPDLDESEVNGTTVVIANGVGKGFAFVPGSSESGVEVLASGSASWLSGGPCEFHQYEALLRFGDLYWVETTGDSEQQLVAVGRFATKADGLAAAAEASAYFTVGPTGELVCELDEWPDDE